MLYTNWQLALVTLGAVPLLVGFTWWFMRVIEPRYTRLRETIGDLNTRIENGLSGIELVKTSSTEGYEGEVRNASEMSTGQHRGSGDSETVLEGIDIDVSPGGTVAIVGSTGAGKSTVAKLLLRLYDVSEGALSVDGHDVRDVRLADLRPSIGYVSQDTFLFDGTVAENVRYGRFNADRDAVVAAAEAAEADGFIEALSEGYDTRVGERGVKLSGGQRQRIAIARTVLQDPEILLLDEATSAVDTETEYLIQRSLDRLAADRTTVVIAHRLSTVKDADTIAVLDDGRVAEQGTHEELLAADGLYAKLWGVQAGEIEDLPETFLDRTASGAVGSDS